MEQKANMQPSGDDNSRRAIRVGLALNVVTVLFTIHFYWVPSGAQLHPVIWFLCVFVIAFVSLGMMPWQARLFDHGRPVLSSWLAAILGFSPLPLAVAMLKHAAWLREFHVH
jgi:hypothetical protein